jgi:putative copper export protein
MCSGHRLLRLSEIAALADLPTGCKHMVNVVLRFIYLLSIALWIGGMAFFSFLAAPSIFKVLPRDAAGDVVTAIFPKYYWQGIICGVIALGASFALGIRDRWNILLIVRTILLGVMIIGILYAVVILQPKIHAVQAQITSFENLSPADPLRLEFGRLHGRSVSVNAAVLLVGVVVVFITAFTMKV